MPTSEHKTADLSLRTWGILVGMFGTMFGVGTWAHANWVVPAILMEAEHIAEDEVNGRSLHSDAISKERYASDRDALSVLLETKFNGIDRQLSEIKEAVTAK